MNESMQPLALNEESKDNTINFSQLSSIEQQLENQGPFSDHANAADFVSKNEMGVESPHTSSAPELIKYSQISGKNKPLKVVDNTLERSLNISKILKMSQDDRFQDPKHLVSMRPTPDEISASRDAAGSEDNLALNDENFADILFQSKHFNSNLDLEKISNFPIEKGNDGKIIPPAQQEAQQNQKLYLQKYGTYVNLPSIYVLDSQINNRFPDYCIQLAKCVLPGDEDYLVKTHKMDGSMMTNSFSQIEQRKQKGLILRLLLKEKSQLIAIREVIIEGVWVAKIQFSDCGNCLAMIIPENPKNIKPQQIRYCRLQKNQGIEEFINQMESYNHKPQSLVQGTPKGQSSKKGFSPSGLTEQKNKQKDMSFIENIIFDQELRFIVGYGETQFLLYNIQKNESKFYEICTDTYLSIHDVAFISSSNVDFKCVLAVRRNIIYQITVFDFFGQDKSIKLNLNFNVKPSNELKVKISKDFSKVVFTDIEEKFMVEQKDGYTIQRKLNMLTGKQVYFIYEPINEPSQFYFIMTKNFDGSVKIAHSNRQQKMFKVTRNVEPGIIRIFDFNVQNEKMMDDGFQKRNFRITGMQDEDQFFDQIDLEEIPVNLDNPANQIFEYRDVYVNTFIFSQMRAQSTSWPYFAYSSLSNYMLLVNAFNRKNIERIQLAPEDESITICDSYITDTYDLFVLILSKETYKLYMIDLDEANANEMDGDELIEVKKRSAYSITEPIFEYMAEDVDHKIFCGLHARGSSRKEPLDRNEKQFVYFLHRGQLYQWISLNEQSKYDKIKPVCKTVSSSFNVINDSQFVVLQEDHVNGKLKEQRIVRVQTNFSQNVQTAVIQRMSTARDKIIALLIDQITNMILFVTQTKQITTESDITIVKLKLFDLNQNIQVFEIELTNQYFIGRLISGLCTLINGHIYFNNNLIKIRYDLIDSKQITYRIDEEQIFDFYTGIFELKPGIQIRSKTPLKSTRYHRMVYITRDRNCMEPQQIMMLPYLHEKRVYLNRQKTNTYYFYSSIETPNNEIKAYNAKVRAELEDQLPKESINYENAKLQAYIMSRLQRSFDKTRTASDNDSTQSIVVVNLTESKFYLYGTEGILQFRYDYTEEQEKYGQPIKSSQNGQYFIFKKSLQDISKQNFLLDEQMIEQFMTINIMKLTFTELKHVKKINLYKNIKETILQNNDKESLKKLGWIYHLKRGSMNEIDIRTVINDCKDICVRICKKDQNQYNKNGHRYERHDIEGRLKGGKTDNAELFYFENGLYENVESSDSNVDTQGKQTPKQMQSLLVTDTHGAYDFEINTQNLFLWNDSQIKFCYLSDGIDNPQKFQEVNFSQENAEKISYFNDLRTCSDPNIFVFTVHQKGGINSIFTWFTKLNTEAEAYDVEDDYELLWDKCGNLQIITQDRLILNKQRCSITTYDYQDLFKAHHGKELPEGVLDNKQGHRFDYKNHNWLIYKEYISLSFSYLTFMILNKLETNDKSAKKNHFDIVPYDYIFNKSTSFLDGKFVSKDSEQLERVLSNFKRVNPLLLELLIYNKYMVYAKPDLKASGRFIHSPAGSYTPLYQAVYINNNRSVEVILKFMTEIKFNSSRNFMNIFPQLVNYQRFMSYLNNLPTQSALMKQKQVLRVDDTYNQTIVKIIESACVNIDDEFYTDCMDEQPVDSLNYKSFPVKVVAFRFAWLLLNPEGKLFLQAIFKNENLAFYKIPTLIMIIEFLYLKYKSVLLTKLLPVFLIQSIFFQANVYAFEGYYHTLGDSDLKEDGLTLNPDFKLLLPYKIVGSILLLGNVVMVGVLIYFQYLMIKNIGIAYLQRFYGLIDVSYISLCMTVFIMQFTQLTTDKRDTSFEQFRDFTSAQRTIETICILMIYIKAGYFLSLIDSIAPLMDNISQVFASIQSFIFLLVMYMFAFSQCFYVLGQNQLQFDNISEEEMSRVGVPYDSFGRSIWYVYFNYMMGGKHHHSFGLGAGSQRSFLYFLFILASVYIDTILLKMLIAIMGSTFASRKQVADEIKIKDHLRFLLDNWHLMDYALKDKSQVTYIISAFLVSNNEQKEDKIKEMQQKLDGIEFQNQDNFRKLQHDISQVYLINMKNHKCD